MTNLSGKVAIVTGASRGIGKIVAALLAGNGAKVVLNYSSNSSEADETVKGIIDAGGDAIAVKADISRQLQVAELFDKAIAAYGKVDILINNAGVMVIKPLKDATEEEYNQQFDINVKGTMYALQQAATKLADNGTIINFSSSTTKMMLPGYAIYSAAKAAVEQMTKVFSKEIGRGISVNAIAPGPTSTELFLSGKTAELIARLAGLNVFNRLADPEDIAKVVLFLASEDSKWISGQVIGVNGAMV